MKPFLKWVGGKHRLAPKISALFPNDWRSRRYIEPFLGGGGMLLHVLESGGDGAGIVATDINKDLILTFVAIRDEPELVCVWLDRYRELHSTDHYYSVRDEFNRERHGHGLFTYQRAAQFIYLNKTGFNGLWRTNKNGEVNVPVGRYAKTPAMYDKKNIEAVSDAMCKVEFYDVEFRVTLDRVFAGDFVYMDPPYVPASDTSNFTSYSADGFDEEQHFSLARWCRMLDARGVLFALSNSNTPLVRELYDGFDFTVIEAPRSVNSKGDRRGSVEEVLVRNTLRY